MSKLRNLVDKLLKSASGEGSRGGTIIGHTRTGKPIYQNSQHESHSAFASHDHLDAMNHHYELWSKTQNRIAQIREQNPNWHPPKAIHDFLKHHYTQMQMHQSRAGRKEQHEVKASKEAGEAKSPFHTPRTIHKSQEVAPFYSAMVIVDTKGEKILLGKRKEDGLWTGPGGGAKVGEFPHEAAIREAFEESNLVIDQRQLQELPMGYSHDMKPVHCYIVRISDEQAATISVVNDPDKEVNEWKWFPLSEKLPEPLTDNRRSTILNAKMFLAGMVMKSYYAMDMSDGMTAVNSGDKAAEMMQRHPLVESLQSLMERYQPGDEPVRILLNANHVLHLVRVDDGIYSGFVKKNEQEAYASEVETVLTIDKMPISTLVQLLESKEIVKDAVTERGQRYAAGMDFFADQIAQQERESQERAALYSLFPEPQTRGQEFMLRKLIDKLMMQKSELIKAKALPIGTVRQWGPYKYVKHSDGWVVVGGEHHGKLMGKFFDEPKYSDFARHHENTSPKQDEPKSGSGNAKTDEGSSPKEEPKAEAPAAQASPSKEDEAKQAHELGKKAFAAGIKAPVQDPAFNAMLKPGPVGTNTHIMEAWTKGWHQANLAAPVPEPKKQEAPTEPVELKPAKTPKKGSAIPKEEPKEEPKQETDELTPEQKKFREERPSLIARIEQLKAHEMSLKEYMEHAKERKMKELVASNVRPGPMGEEPTAEYVDEVSKRSLSYMERNKRRHNTDFKREHKTYTEAAVKAGFKVSDKALKEYPGLGGSDLPEGMDMELNKKTNMVGMIDLGKSSKLVTKKFISHVNECNKLVAEMGIKFKTKINFKATNLNSMGKRTRGTYQHVSRTIDLKDMSAGGKTLMHEIGHAVDYAMQDLSMRGRHQEMMRSTGDSDLHKLYREMDQIVTSSDYYTQVEDRSHRQYLHTPTEVFARAFEVYSLHKAEQMGLSKDFLETFVPDVFKSKDQEAMKLRDQINDLTKKLNDIWREKRDKPDEYTKEADPIREQVNSLREEYKKRLETNGGGWGQVPEEKQMEYKTKISAIMEKILSQDQIRKSIQQLELTTKLQKGGKGLPVGSIRMWAGQKFIKQGDGHWMPMPSQQQGMAQPQAQGNAAVQAQPAPQPEEKKPEIKAAPEKAEPPHPTEHLKPRKGEGGHVKLHSEDLDKQLKHGPLSIISAGRNPNNPEDRALTDEQINERYKKLEQDLKEGGYKYTKVDGHYGGKEESFMVHHADEHHMNSLGKKYNQDSVIHSKDGKNKLHFTTGEHEGKHHKGDGYQEVPDADDYYSELTTSDGVKKKFNLGLDFGQHHEDETGAEDQKRNVV